jgi:hypothetical protein
MTNFERAASDDTRANPLKRNNVFNTYSDNLAYAAQRGGLPAVIDMAISDSYNAGKPGVGKAAFAAPKAASAFGDTMPTGAAANRIAGDISSGAQATVQQRDVFGAKPTETELDAKLKDLSRKNDTAALKDLSSRKKEIQDWKAATGDPREGGEAGVNEWYEMDAEEKTVDKEIERVKADLAKLG